MVILWIGIIFVLLVVTIFFYAMCRASAERERIFDLDEKELDKFYNYNRGENMKIIDIDNKGNVVRVYLGDDSCFDYRGDDWKKVPYEHNACTVYDEFIKEEIDIYFPFDYYVCPAYEKFFNSPYSKEDLKNRIVAAYSIGKWDEKNYAEEHVMNLFYETPKTELLNELVNNNIKYHIYEHTTDNEVLDE